MECSDSKVRTHLSGMAKEWLLRAKEKGKATSKK
jgi:hypothetical protein